MDTCGADRERIAQAIQLYFDGMHYRDLIRLRKAFHPPACLFGYRRQQCLHVPVEDWLRIVESRPVPASNGEPHDMRIMSTDISGCVATAKVAYLYQGLRFVDHLTLLRTTDAEWVIVNKACQCESQE